MRWLFPLGLLLTVVCFASWAMQPRLETGVAALTAKTLRLQNGDIVRLAAIQAPNRARNAKERDEPFAPEAFSALKELVEGKSLTVLPIGKERDRKNRIVAEVLVDDTSLQETLLRRGAGWTYTFHDTRSLADRFYTAEAEAERMKLGVWSISDYAVLDAADIDQHDNEFRLVEGRPKLVAIKEKGRSYINFGDDWKTDFTLVINQSDLRRFDRAWLENLKGKPIRVRGWLFNSGGPAMELTHPEQIQFRD